MDIFKEWDKIKNEVIADYHHLHQYPELGPDEVKTADYITEKLEKYGIVTERFGNSVIGFLEGNLSENTIALRADIDALPIVEKTDTFFQSKNNGVMHACGHDLHTAALLGAAQILAEHKSELQGNVKFIFESDEEGSGSAKSLIAQNILQGVDKIYGIHVRPELSCGTVGVKYGKSYAAADVFTVRIIGKSAHGAEPQNGVDSILVAAQVINALQTIVSRNLSPTSSAVISIGEIHGGTVANVIAGETVLKGIIRTFGQEERAFIKERFTETVNQITSAMGASADIQLKESFPGVVNHNSEVAFVQDCATKLLGEEKVLILEEPTLTTEDFGYFLQEIPGCFYHIGVESEYPLHSEYFHADENALRYMTLMHIMCIVENQKKY